MAIVVALLTLGLENISRIDLVQNEMKAKDEKLLLICFACYTPDSDLDMGAHGKWEQDSSPSLL